MATVSGASNSRIDIAGSVKPKEPVMVVSHGLVQFQHKAMLAGCLIFVALLIATPLGG
jgi:hypothetical protein